METKIQSISTKSLINFFFSSSKPAVLASQELLAWCGKNKDEDLVLTDFSSRYSRYLFYLFLYSLKDGRVLISLANHLAPGSVNVQNTGDSKLVIQNALDSIAANFSVQVISFKNP